LIDRERLLSHFERHPDRTWELEELLTELKIPEDQEKSLRRLLKTLVHEGALERGHGRQYRQPRQARRATGTIRYGRDGRPTVLIVGPRGERTTASLGGDVSVGDGDRVEVELSEGRRGGAMARLVTVVSRARALGVLRRVGRASYIEPEGHNGDAITLEKAPDAPDGTLVEFEVLAPRTRSTSAMGRVVATLGRPGERATEVRRLEITRNLPLVFPEAVEAAARELGHEVDPAEVARRRDLRELPLVTIDGEFARDFDDAVCAEKYGKDGFRVWVAIADVAHYVTPHGAIDKEARKRGTSTYLPHRVYPMLPEALSNELCSLKPHVERLCFVAEMIIDAEGAVVSTDLYRATMRSRARLTYTEVAAALDGQPNEVTRALLPNLLLLFKASQARLMRRLKRGSIDLDLPEAEILFDEAGLPVDSQKRERNDAHRLIEDLMLLANEAVAAWFGAREFPTLYRVHEDPNPDKLAVFLELCAEVGVVVKWKKGKIRPKDVALLLVELSEHPAGKHLHALLLRTLAQARYAVDNSGHFGLAAEEYLHFTSPIRRYPDLLVHRLLAAHLEGREVGYSEEALRGIADECSDCERRASLAEREARDLDKSYVAALHIGEPLQGTVTGVQAFGVFVSIDQPFVEGMIPIEHLGDDWFEADERGAYLVGRDSGVRISLGMPIAVEIVRVDVELRRVELRPVEDVTAEPGTDVVGEAELERERAHTPKFVVAPPRPGETALERLRRTARARAEAQQTGGVGRIRAGARPGFGAAPAGAGDRARGGRDDGARGGRGFVRAGEGGAVRGEGGRFRDGEGAGASGPGKRLGAEGRAQPGKHGGKAEGGKHGGGAKAGGKHGGGGKAGGKHGGGAKAGGGKHSGGKGKGGKPRGGK
jgi:ribonuclease R